jgi:two-component system cell cycle sensor histidine kinase/response regulator CckA
MNGDVKILMLEDNEADAQLMIHAIGKQGISVSTEQVKDKESFFGKLDAFDPDLVLVDYNLPDIRGDEAIRHVRRKSDALPVILVTGTLDDMTAVGCMKAGAWDYVLKDQLVRLGPAIVTALKRRETLLEQRKAEEMLRRAALEWHTTFNTMTDGVGLLSRKGEFVRCNEALESANGTTPEFLIGKRCCDVVCAKDVDGQGCAFDRLIDSGRRQSLIVRMNGEKWYLVTLDPMKDDGELVSGAVVVMSDITDLKSAENQLYEERTLLRTFLDHAPDQIFVKDTESRFLLANSQAVRWLGFERQDEIVGKTDFDFLPREYAASCFEDERKIFETGGPTLNKEENSRGPDGVERWCSVSKVPFHDAEGRIKGIVGISRDITEMKAAQAQIQSLARFPSEDPSPVIRVDAEGTVMYGNDASRDLFNSWKCDVGEAVPEGWRATIRQVFESGNRCSMEVGVDDRVYTFICMPIVESGYVNMYGVDVTESKRLEEQFRQAQKMEAVGRLAGGIAHDFNNMLTAMISYADYLMMQNDEESPVSKIALEIKKAGNRAADLTHQLLAFSRRQIMVPEVLNLNSVVREMEGMLKRLIGEDIFVQLRTDADLGSIIADKVQMEQVVMNLVINARDAMPDGGELTIETRIKRIEKTMRAVDSEIHPGGYAVLRISDNGTGMTEEVLAHLFEPFFTTKKQGEGTGLGLATVFGIVRQSEGHIQVRSTPGKGTVFTLLFPLVEAEETRMKEGRETAVPVSGGETILVVEDEEILRNLFEFILKKNGYSVLIAANGPDALERMKNPEKPLDLVVTDMVMPGMSGKELIEKVRNLYPKVKILYTSGYLREEVIDDEDASFLNKPFDEAELIEKIRGVLNG